MSSENRIALFPKLSLFIEDNDVNLSIIKQECLAYLNCLTDKMNDLHTEYWYQNPEYFLDWKSLSVQHTKLIEMQANADVKFEFDNDAALAAFWVKQNKRNDILGEKALSVLLPFPSTYLCETAFWTMAVMKTKYRNRIYQEYNLCCALTQNIVPNFDKLAESGQHHGSK